MGTQSIWPDQALVGYPTAWDSPSNEMISEALANNYKVFVYAFGKIDPSNTVTLPDGIPEPDLSTQLNNIHDGGGLALLSFGGQTNTFNPGSDAVQAADKTVSLIQQYGFDGVDLDLEGNYPTYVNPAYLEAYIQEMRNKFSDILLTCAPQIAGGYGGPASFAPADIFTTDFLEQAKFDAILVQEYNQFGGASFGGKEDTDLGFISASFSPITEIVPSESKIVIGEPACEAAGSGLSNPADVVSDINSNGVRQSPQYGGIMVWSINFDAGQNWVFAQGVSQVIG